MGATVQPGTSGAAPALEPRLIYLLKWGECVVLPT